MREWAATAKQSVVPSFCLASASPRRRDLLRAAGLSFAVVATDVDETPAPGERPRALVERLARTKAAAVQADGDAIVIAADTTVALEDLVFNKPVDDRDALRMLRALSGRSHDVFTGFAVRRGRHEETGVVGTRVTFRQLEDAALTAYIATGEHRDKAGAYGIQGAAAVLVDRIDGSLTNVIGLPVAEVLAAIARLRGVG